MDQTVEPMSPSRPSSHSISNFSPNYDTKSVRAGLIHDLKRFGIHVDDEFVLKEVLKIDEASLKDADACADLLRSTHRKDIESLQKVVMHGKVKDEKHMYNPLENLCRTIATYGSKSPRRHLVITNSKHLESESHFTGSLIPDLCAVEVGNGEVESIKTRDGKVFLRQVAAFAEVKKSDKDDPVPARSSATLNTAQVADYAAMLFIGRPFNLFVIGLSICGNKFRVGYFDRSGILFSEARDMFSKQGLPIFIKVIRRITCDMSNIDLGHNPNIHLLEGHTYYQNEYPKFRVDTGHQSSYVTEGRPLWISFSYLGRGTSTWVASSSGGVKLVLKFAWRSENRRGEASIYNDVGEMPGVARLMDGGDMMWKQRGLGQISIRSIRNLDPKVKFERNVILHFVGINPIGKMLWDAKDDLEFCLGIWAAIKGYRRLNKKKGFLHRDISPGNVFIWDEFQNGKPAPSDDEIGFLADLEFASFPTSQSIYVARPRETVTRLPSGKTVTTPIDSSRISSKNLSNTAVHSVFEEVAITKSGAGPEMTVSDIVFKLLRSFLPSVITGAINDNKDIQRTAEHDYESFLLVFIYAAFQRAIRKAKDARDEKTVSVLQTCFKKVYSGSTLKEILTQRSSFGDWQSMISPLESCLGENLGMAVRHAASIVYAQVSYTNRPPIQSQKLDFRASKFYQGPKTLEAISLTWEEVKMMFRQLLKEYRRSA
ncbi:hypothetical protein C0989_000179 [Termitomyces sp. Mn162]|nr:hypothetical protein C0989_000179 [Termitomyces sp. Mn162]